MLVILTPSVSVRWTPTDSTQEACQFGIVSRLKRSVRSAYPAGRRVDASNNAIADSSKNAYEAINMITGSTLSRKMIMALLWIGTSRAREGPVFAAWVVLPVLFRGRLTTGRLYAAFVGVPSHPHDRHIADFSQPGRGAAQIVRDVAAAKPSGLVGDALMEQIAVKPKHGACWHLEGNGIGFIHILHLPRIAFLAGLIVL